MDLNNTVRRRLSYGALILAILLFLNAIVSGVIPLLHPASSSTLKTSSAFSAVQVQPLPNIAAWHLFGFYQPPVTLVNSQNIGSLPTTRLQLKLIGLFTDSNPKLSKALISAEGQPAKSYGVGDNVPGGATVYEILADRVILQQDGQLERLDLPIKPLHFSAPPVQLHFDSQS